QRRSGLWKGGCMKLPTSIAFCSDSLTMLKELGGYYEVRRDPNGKRLSPLVGYAGRYETPDGPKQYVGDIYANFAKAERFSSVRTHFLTLLLQRENNDVLLREVDSFFGAPMGGLFWAATMGEITGKASGFFEKKVLAMATPTEREKSRLIFGRH
ncbi:MAG: hypothetical protein V1895_01960, partial [Parcubacteria group bacterium]